MQHCKDGYRGKCINIEKTDRFRILFLGGSTTYSSAVLNPEETYPSQTIKHLNTFLKGYEKKLEKYTGFEGINAGLEGGHSCDELNAYIHKFRYYKPDMIILHSLGNDAEFDFESMTNYTPDEVNFRMPEIYLAYRYPLPGFFFKSYFISYLVIRFDLLERLNHDQPNMRRDPYYECAWFPEKMRKAILYTKFNNSPTINNISTLVREALLDSTMVMLMSFAVDTNSTECKTRPYYVKNIEMLNACQRELASKFGVGHIDYNYKIIDPTCWVDDCHLTAKGDSLKGLFVAKEIIKYIDQKGLFKN